MPKSKRARSIKIDKRQAQSPTPLSDDLTQGLVLCRYSQHYDVEALEGDHKGQIFSSRSRSKISDLVCGDDVLFQVDKQGNGIIESQLPRKNCLERPDNFGKLKPVAANITQMLIMIAPKPAIQTNLIDRYLVAAELLGIKPLLVLNKLDLLNQDNQTAIQNTLDIYRELGYTVSQIIASRHQTPQLDTVPELVCGQTSIVVGQSGVGKSSLLNILLPSEELIIGDLSEQTSEGTHTTTVAKLYRLPEGGRIIDSPGIRDFSLWHIDEQQLVQGFVELHALSHDCKFRNCQHRSEPGCAVMQAAQNGTLYPARFESFLRIRESIKEQQARGLGQLY